MSDRSFFDTNILVYAFASNDPRGPIAEALIQNGGIISVQVLNEFVNVCWNKLRVPWSKIETALDIIIDLLKEPVPLTLDIHRDAVALARDHQLSFYDSLIIAAALHADCGVIYTEDMQARRQIGTVSITNPFTPP